MKIQVQQIFSRRRVMGSEKILPGVYETSNPSLFGLADELIELGFAVYVDTIPQAVDSVPESTEDTATEERQPKRNAKRR